MYGGNLAIKERSPHLWAAMERDIRVVHYTLVKLFPSRTGLMLSVEALQDFIKQEKKKGGMFVQEVQWWDDNWNAMRQAQWPTVEKCFAEHPVPNTTVL